MIEENRRVVIIGGGITGLSAAYYLQKESKEKNVNIEITLIEASNRLGGKIQTIRKNGFTIERGPDSFLARKQSAGRLVKEVGLEDQLIHNSTGQAYILLKGELHPMPEGAVMGIPTKLSPFVTTGLFSPIGKMRAAADLILPASKKTGDDQSLGSFFRRRLGDEVVDNLIEPLLSGIYAGDIDKLSLEATFPQFQQVEEKYRSLILGMKQSSPKQQSASSQKKKGMFQTLKGGLQTLVDALEEKLDEVAFLKAVKVEKIEKTNVEHYRLSLSNGSIIECDSVVVATPHHATANLIPSADYLSPLQKMKSTTVATVAMAFDESALKNDIDGTGFVVSRNNDYTITACTWTHKKWPHTTPEGKVILRCYVGRSGEEAIVDQSDEEIKKVVLDDLNKIMEITTDPEFTIITRWREAMPQYAVGHKKMLREVNERLAKDMPGIYIAGSSFEGVGLPDCINSGEAAVKAILTRWNKQTIEA
ncbi:protoporphyrinogen oxidase [Sutcliffiella rhizosphaerae]|uniref:Coproporphyrinogen III oxidase n=1 Tax=Sutcliffiella rhizosphaerae TaxID=2880967 RepID=A0ABM8YSH8_9BACI|nr:protoporphyrinogen oxidase [Sutcliffiella rhizosphaerae]CAG9622960.1 Protoporphyrinogen oxidase [Sutcliffiella rhizosphaerae]